MITNNLQHSTISKSQSNIAERNGIAKERQIDKIETVAG
jgi:hypothetical protein